jgi:NAD(P)-dependent dehydrogenase (short-subunit alcohol dehydrogenase family)
MGDRLKDKVALVSGAGSSGPGWGNGKATAVLFAREGAKILAADINLDAARQTKRIVEAEGGICEAVTGNVSRADDVAAMVDTCIATFGRIGVLHNNVGIVEAGGPVETEVADVHLPTPHGEQERFSDHQTNPCGFFFQPLMGNRNAHVRAVRALRRLLPTPHGEQEL